MKIIHRLYSIILILNTLLVSSQNENNINSASFIQNKYLQGVDFYAVGNEPFWSIDIDNDGAIKFTSLDDPEIIGKSVLNTSSGDPGVRQFSMSNKLYELNISVIRKDCSDTMSDITYNYSVKLEYKKLIDNQIINLEGCGNQVPDFSLDNAWTVLTVHDINIGEINFMNGHPTVNFDVLNNKITGNNGCNNFFGSFQFDGDLINFQNLAETMMACPNLELSSNISRILSNTKLNYKFQHKRLILSNNDKIVMILQKEEKSQR